ncbi:hypothetical protein N0824_01987 [Microcystis sp. 0824]|nr:hypothetical protein N0824_01987 [Microcystis sp. 0824]
MSASYLGLAEKVGRDRRSRCGESDQIRQNFACFYRQILR